MHAFVPNPRMPRYVVFAVFAVLNVVTGICRRALPTAFSGQPARKFRLNSSHVPSLQYLLALPAHGDWPRVLTIIVLPVSGAVVVSVALEGLCYMFAPQACWDVTSIWGLSAPAPWKPRGVFCNTAIESARADKDNTRSHASSVMDIQLRR